jgi:hypothetical protein
MSDRATGLANQFSRLSREFISTFEGLNAEQLQAQCEGEQCTVTALGSHVAGVHRLAAEWIQKSASAQPLPEVTMAMVNQANAEQFERDAGRDKDEVLEELRHNSAQASRLVRGLTDEELDRSLHFTLFEREVTTEDLVRNILIADVQGHLQSVKQAAAWHAVSR